MSSRRPQQPPTRPFDSRSRGLALSTDAVLPLPLSLALSAATAVAGLALGTLLGLHLSPTSAANAKSERERERALRAAHVADSRARVSDEQRRLAERRLTEERSLATAARLRLESQLAALRQRLADGDAALAKACRRRWEESERGEGGEAAAAVERMAEELRELQAELRKAPEARAVPGAGGEDEWIEEPSESED